MSVRNTLAHKAFRRMERSARKGLGRIQHCGVIVRKTLVRQHRYLAERGLPHSGTVASVFIGH